MMKCYTPDIGDPLVYDILLNKIKGIAFSRSGFVFSDSREIQIISDRTLNF